MNKTKQWLELESRVADVERGVARVRATLDPVHGLGLHAANDARMELRGLVTLALVAMEAAVTVQATTKQN